MTLFFRLLWPRSWRSLSAWTPLIAVGAISCIGLSLALGIGFGFQAQQETALVRDGTDGPRSEAERAGQVEGPLRASRVEATGYGPLVFTVFAGETGQRLGLPGIPRVEQSGTVMVSPAVLAQLEDDWTGELDAWLGGRTPQALPDSALAHPREMVIIEFIDTVPPGAELSFRPVVSGEGWFYPSDSSFVVLGIFILVLPSVALARAGAVVHLNARSRRYGLLRTLGTPPRHLAVIIASDMAVPLLAGALLGSVAYAAVMSSSGSFTLAGSSYWTRDLLLPVVYAGAVPLVTVLIGLASIALVARRAGRDPVGTLRRDRPRRVSYLTYVSVAGLPTGAAAVFSAGDADFTLSVWLISGGMILGVVGLLGLTRLVVTIAGRAIVNWTRAQVAGSRMSRSGGDALLGVSATAVAVFLVAFVVYSNFDRPPPDVGTFDVVARLDGSIGTDVIFLEPVAAEVAGYDGVTRVVHVGLIRARIDGKPMWVHTMTCGDVPGSVELDAPCVVGNIYLEQPAEAPAVMVDADLQVVSGYRQVPSSTGGTIEIPVKIPDPDETVTGTHTVGGQVTASWFDIDGGSVLIVDRQPVSARFGFLLVTTDGDRVSMRQVMQGLRNLPEVQFIFTRPALSSGVTEDTLVFYPYLTVMATSAAGMGTVTLLYAVLLLFRQRQAEFRILRCQGATRTLLAVDLGLLFAVPLILAFGLAVASGLALAATLNAAFDLPTQYGTTQVVPVLATMLAVGMAATVLVAVWATRIPPLVTDPDAATA